MTTGVRLAGRTALVVGATGVIGSQVCAQLAAEGATLLVHCRSDLTAARALASGEHQLVQANLSEPQGLAELSSAMDAIGGIDILINTIHLCTATSSVAELTPDDLRAHLESVVLHAELSRLVIPGMRAKTWGRIVYVSGALMTRPAPGRAAYGAAKAGASTLTRYLALEEGRAGITANIVAPGRVVDPDAPAEVDPEWAQLAESLAARTALGRFPSPDEVASAIVGLTLPSAGGVTGQTVWVTGGEPIA